MNSWTNDTPSVFVDNILIGQYDRQKEIITDFALQDVQLAVKRLKCDKTAGVDGLYAECVKFAHMSVCSLLRKLFNACIKHSFVPINFCSGRIVPVPKKPNICDAFGDYI